MFFRSIGILDFNVTYADRCFFLNKHLQCTYNKEKSGKVNFSA